MAAKFILKMRIMIGTTIPVFGELNKKGFSKQKLKQFVCQFTLYTNKNKHAHLYVGGITEQYSSKE
jgi:tRNA splicing endonuclease